VEFYNYGENNEKVSVAKNEIQSSYANEMERRMTPTWMKRLEW